MKKTFSDLFEVCNQKQLSVKGVADLNWNFSFQRCLDENQQNQQNRMRDLLQTYPLGVDKDRALWNLNDKHIFTVRSMYKILAKV
jgi:hypothetical protein